VQINYKEVHVLSVCIW